MWYIYTTEYYSSLKSMELLIYGTTRMNHGDIMLSKKLDKKRQVLYDSTYIKYLK